MKSAQANCQNISHNFQIWVLGLQIVMQMEKFMELRGKKVHDVDSSDGS